MNTPSLSDASIDKSTVISWAEPVARLGYVAKGIVFGTVGVLALLSSFNLAGGDVTGSKGAIDYLAGLGGGLVLIALTVGLAAFAFWRFVQALLDPEDKGSDPKGIIRRFGLAISGLSYSSLAVFAANQLLRTSGAESEGGTEDKVAEVMSVPGGVWAIAIFGLIMLGIGFYQAYRSYAASFTDHWSTAAMGSGELRWATLISRVGVAARAIAFVLIGWSFLNAARNSNAIEADGLDGVLKSFGDGTWLLAAIGCGFICYGLYCIANAKYKTLKR